MPIPHDDLGLLMTLDIGLAIPGIAPHLCRRMGDPPAGTAHYPGDQRGYARDCPDHPRSRLHDPQTVRGYRPGLAGDRGLVGLRLFYRSPHKTPLFFESRRRMLASQSHDPCMIG